MTLSKIPVSLLPADGEYQEGQPIGHSELQRTRPISAAKTRTAAHPTTTPISPPELDSEIDLPLTTYRKMEYRNSADCGSIPGDGFPLPLTNPNDVPTAQPHS